MKETMRAFVIDGDFSPKEGYVLSDREKATRRALRGNMVFNHIQLGLRDVEIPEIKDDEVLIKIGACGICGTDLHLVEVGDDGYTVYGSHCKFPVISGHEFSGEVVKLGSRVKTVQIGDLVAIEEMQWCGECPSCRISKFNQCQNLEEIGISKNGGFAIYCAVKEKFCCNINNIAEHYGDKMAALELGALAEPTCVAYSGMVINGGGVRPGDTVVIFGAGPIGLASIAVAKASGAGQIIVFDTKEEKLALAKNMGATHVYHSLQVSPSETVNALTGQKGANMIVECAGAFQATYPEICKMLAIEARIIQLGISSKTAPVDITALQVKNARLQGSLGHAGNGIYPSVLNMMASGNLDMRKMVTGRYSLEHIEDAFKAARLPESGKVLVSFRYE